MSNFKEKTISGNKLYVAHSAMRDLSNYNTEQIKPYFDSIKDTDPDYHKKYLAWQTGIYSVIVRLSMLFDEEDIKSFEEHNAEAKRLCDEFFKDKEAKDVQI